MGEEINGVDVIKIRRLARSKVDLERQEGLLKFEAAQGMQALWNLSRKCKGV